MYEYDQTFVKMQWCVISIAQVIVIVQLEAILVATKGIHLF